MEFVDVKIVFVVIGGDIDFREIEEILLYKDVLVVVFGEVDLIEFGKLVMVKVFKGSVLIIEIGFFVCFG